MQGILQGFRVVDSGSKLGREYPVTAYRMGGPVTLEKLLEFIPDSNGEQQRLLCLMRKGRLSLAEAREKYPDWYERRIVKKERRGHWTVKRDLYDWWLHRIGDEIRVGHRFYGIMTLAIYAKKCGISEDELREDAFSLLKPYDDMSVEDINRFTKDDVVCEKLRESLVRLLLVVAAHRLRIGCMSGVGSIRRAARPTATGTPALTPKRSASGGTDYPRL